MLNYFGKLVSLWTDYKDLHLRQEPMCLELILLGKIIIIIVTA